MYGNFCRYLVVKIICGFCPKRYLEITVDFFGREFNTEPYYTFKQLTDLYMEIFIHMRLERVPGFEAKHIHYMLHEE